MKLRKILLAAMMFVLCCVPASALKYSFDAPEDYLFGRPTSDDTIYEQENPNVDRSKNTALVAPGFGTPTSYLPNFGEYLTPNLVPGALNSRLVNSVGSAGAKRQAAWPAAPPLPGRPLGGCQRQFHHDSDPQQPPPASPRAASPAATRR